MIEQKKTGRSGGPFRFNELWIYAIILAILGGLFLWDGGFGENKDMSWNEFRQMMNQGAFTQITVDRGEKTATAQLNKRAADSLFTHRSPVLGREQKRIEYTIKTQIPTVDRFAEAYDTSGTTAKVDYKEESSRWISPSVWLQLLRSTVSSLMLVLTLLTVCRPSFRARTSIRIFIRRMPSSALSSV